MKKLIFTLMLSTFVVLCANAKDIYVTTTGDNTSGGTSWSTAKATLSGAISIAVDGDVIHVAAGTYDFSMPAGFGTGKSNITVLGGYEVVDVANGIANRNLKVDGDAWEFEHETIFNAVAYTGSAANTDNKNSRIIHIFTSATGVELNGITFQNGGGKHDTGNELGGAVQIAGANAKLRFCTFKNNSVTKTDNTSGGNGGAIHLNNVASVTVDSCYFYNNSAIGGNGGAAFSHPAASSEATFNACVFDSNLSTSGGGGIRTNTIRKTNIKNSIFMNNVAKDGATFRQGAALYNYGSSAAASIDEIENCVFYNNEGTTSVFLSGDVMRNCTFVNNIGGLRTAFTNSGKIYNTVAWGNKDTNGTTAVGFNINQVPELIQNCASDVNLTGDYVSNFVLLDASNTAATGPQFKLPTTFVGSGDLSIETPNWSLNENSALETAGLTVNAPATDIMGKARTGTSSSIGAYEYSGTTALLENDVNDIFLSVTNNTIYISNDSPISIRIMSLNGQQVAYSLPALNHSVQLPSGIYIVLATNSGKTSVRKVIIQ